MTRKRGMMFRPAVESLESRVLFTTYYVDTVRDQPGGGLNDGLLSLREAITAANTDHACGDAEAGQRGVTDHIFFASRLRNRTITLAGKELEVTSSMWIGGADLNVTIDAGGLSQVFSINTSGSVGIRNLTLVKGNAQFGGVIGAAGSGKVFFSQLNITNGLAGEGGGLSINDRITATIEDCIFDSNLAANGGGALFNDSSGLVTVVDSRFSNNRVVSAGSFGGGVMNAGDHLVLSGSLVHANEAQSRGGGIYSARGTLEVVRDTIDTNLTFADEAGGGGIAVSAGLLRLLDTTISRNHAVSREAYGGGVSVGGTAWADIRNTTITNNVAGEGGGGGLHTNTTGRTAIYDSGVDGNMAGNGYGGAGIYALETDLEIHGSRIAQNSFAPATGTGGGIGVWSAHGSGSLLVTDSSIVENQSQHGAGIFVVADIPVTLDHVDVSRNHANWVGGGVSINGAGVARAAVTTIRNSTVNDNVANHAVGGISYGSNKPLTIDNSVISGNEGGILGGGLYTSVGPTISDSTITGNRADAGGGIYYNSSPPTLINTVVSGNSVNDIDS
jgi:hypothetical protein